jgi:hypothetical protein
MGLLVKTKNTKVLNPFIEGVALYTKQHKLACEFSYGARSCELQDICKEIGLREVLPKVDLNGTRMTSLYNLFHANLRLRPAMDTYLARETNKVKGLTTAKGIEAYNRLLSITNSDAEWRSAAEAEAGLGSCKGQIILSQMEKGFTGAMATALERKVRKEFASDVPKMVIDTKTISPGAKPIRTSVCYGDMTATGRKFYDRAEISAAERLPTAMSEAESCKALLDLRTLKFCDDYLTQREMIAAKGHLENAYVQYCVNANVFKYGSTTPATPVETATAESPKKRKFAGGSVFDALDVGEDEPVGSDLDGAAALRKTFIAEFRVAWKNWRAYVQTIQFVKKFPDQLAGMKEEELDIVDHLLELDVAPLYAEADTKKVFRLPQLAYQRLGDNMAASFCERMNSIAKDILDEGHTLLNDAELEGMIVLRANRKFMKLVRTQWKAEVTLYALAKGLDLEPNACLN